MEYGDILIYIESMIESIEFEELDMLEIKTKLQELAGEIEDNVNIDNEGLDSYDFS